MGIHLAQSNSGSGSTRFSATCNRAESTIRLL